MTAITAETIAKLEAKGFNRWTKNGMDRLYIDATNYGAEFSYYNSGNLRSAKFQGERISNADGRRLNATKAYIDIATGELHIQTDYYYDDEIREAIEAIIAEVETEIEAEEETTDESDETKEDTMTEHDTDLTTFDTITEATEYVETAIGDRADQFDIECIAREVTDWANGKLTLTADGDAFWSVVSKHDTTLRYNIVIGDDRDNVEDVHVDEYYNTLDEATVRFDELKSNFDFDDHDELWLYENIDNSFWTSIDAYTAGDRN